MKEDNEDNPLIRLRSIEGKTKSHYFARPQKSFHPASRLIFAQNVISEKLAFPCMRRPYRLFKIVKLYRLFAFGFRTINIIVFFLLYFAGDRNTTTTICKHRKKVKMEKSIIFRSLREFSFFLAFFFKN